MNKTTVVPATRELIDDFLLRPIRQQDINEHVLLSGQRVQDSLKDVDLKFTRVCLSPNGWPIAVWGLAGEYVWLLAAVVAEPYARSIQRHWKRELEVLANWRGPDLPIFALNIKSTSDRRWHEALGFVVHYEDDFTILYRRDFEWVR